MKNTYATNFPQNRLDQLFSTGGDGSGTTNMNVAVATDFKVVAPTETEVQITRILFKMRDANMRLIRRHRGAYEWNRHNSKGHK